MGRKRREYAPELKGRITEIDEGELLWSGKHVALYTELEQAWGQFALLRINGLEAARHIDAKQYRSLMRVVCALPYHRERGYLVDGLPVFSVSQRQLRKETGLDKDTAGRALRTLCGKGPGAVRSLVILSEAKGRATKYGYLHACPLLRNIPSLMVSPLQGEVSPLQADVSPLQGDVSPQKAGYGDCSLVNLSSSYLEAGGGYDELAV